MEDFGRGASRVVGPPQNMALVFRSSIASSANSTWTCRSMYSRHSPTHSTYISHHPGSWYFLLLLLLLLFLLNVIGTDCQSFRFSSSQSELSAALLMLRRIVIFFPSPKSRVVSLQSDTIIWCDMRRVLLLLSVLYFFSATPAHLKEFKFWTTNRV